MAKWKACEVKISIHAPAKERHRNDHIYRLRHDISIHAPAKERHLPEGSVRDDGDFNPRSREGATFVRLSS